MRKRTGWGAILLASFSAGSVVAHTAETPPADPAQISRADDLERTCEELAAEASTLSDRMGENGQPSLFGRLGGLARTGAQFLPGGALVVAGADALTGSGRQARDEEAEATRYRWHYLNGLYLGRGCEPPPATPHGSHRPGREGMPQSSPPAAPPPPGALPTSPVAPPVTVTPPSTEPPTKTPASGPASATPSGAAE